MQGLNDQDCYEFNAVPATYVVEGKMDAAIVPR